MSSQELGKAKHKWKMFECRTMQNYHDCYLKLNVDAEYCQKLSYQTYRLDVAQFFTVPIMPKDDALGITKQHVELMTDPEQLHMIKPSVRDGMASVFETKYFKANNRYLPGFKLERLSTFGFSVDTNNLYGGLTQSEFLSIGNFQFAIEESITEILNMPKKFDQFVLR